MAKSRIKAKIFETKYFGLIIGIFVFLIISVINYYTILFTNLEKNTLDTSFWLKAQSRNVSIKEGVTIQNKNPLVSDDIIILGIDNKTLDVYGKWPFPRAIEANLVNTFSRIQDQSLRERAIFLDINFIERDLKYPENDALMIESIKENGKIFLESFFHSITFTKSITQEHTERLEVLFENCGYITAGQIDGSWKDLQEWKSIEAPLKPYAAVAYKYGGVSSLSDKDQVYREQPLISRYAVLKDEIYFKDLSTDISIDPDKLERLSWIDKSGRFYDIPTPLTTEGLAALKLQMEKYAPLKDIDLDGDGKTDDSQFIIRKYRDYIIPAITLSLALEYFNKDFKDLDIKIGKYVHINNPERYNTEIKAWEPLIESYAQYVFPKIIEKEEFLSQIYDKIEDKSVKRVIGNYFIENKVFNKYILKEDLKEKEIDQLCSLLTQLGWDKIKKVKEAVIKDYIEIPIDNKGKMLINFMGNRSSTTSDANRTFTVRPFYTYVDDPGPDQDDWKKTKGVTDKIVIVGMFATGLADEKPTPFGLMFGPEVMANALNTIIMENFLSWSPEWLNTLILLFLIMAIAFLASRVKMLLALAISFFTVVAYAVVVNSVFDSFNFLLPFFPSTFGVLFTFISIVVYRVMTEEREKKKIKNTFGKYVNPAVVDTLLSNPPELGGVDKELTVLFSDIRGFTTLSERMTPQALVNHLNAYLTAMTDIIMEFEGTLDKYVGDEIMCFWGAPLPQKEHALLACKCALKQMEALHALNEQWPPEGRIDIGIGLNSGIMTVGNMGSPGRMNYTLMGDNVNLGARLEGTNKMYMTNIIISEYTYGLVKDKVIVRELDNIRVKGKNKQVLIYELIDMIEEEPKLPVLEESTQGKKQKKLKESGSRKGPKKEE